MWATCRVIKAGPTETGEIAVTLAEVTNAFLKIFIADNKMGKEQESRILATALTAISTKCKVEAGIQDPLQDYGKLTALYLVADS